MLCEWLTRGAVCSSVHSLFGLPGGSSCTHEEVLLGRLLEAAVDALGSGRVLRPAEVRHLLDLLVAKSGAEALLSLLVREDAVGVDWDYCPLGFALGRAVTVFAGELVERAEEFYAPYSALMQRFGMVHVFAYASTDEEREEAFRRYGVEAVVTCLRRPPWRIKTYVVACDAANAAADVLMRAMGQRPYTGSTRLAPGVYVE